MSAARLPPAPEPCIFAEYAAFRSEAMCNKRRGCVGWVDLSSFPHTRGTASSSSLTVSVTVIFRSEAMCDKWRGCVGFLPVLCVCGTHCIFILTVSVTVMFRSVASTISGNSCINILRASSCSERQEQQGKREGGQGNTSSGPPPAVHGRGTTGIT